MWQGTGSTSKCNVRYYRPKPYVQCVVVLICFCWVQWGERESGSNDTCCLACFVLFAMFLSLFPSFSLPAGLMPVSSSSSSCFVRAAVICSSSARILYVLAAFLIFLHHILQNSCRLFFVFLVLIFLIRAKRVSNWYIPKKKSARVPVCPCARVK